MVESAEEFLKRTSVCSGCGEYAHKCECEPWRFLTQLKEWQASIEAAVILKSIGDEHVSGTEQMARIQDEREVEARAAGAFDAAVCYQQYAEWIRCGTPIKAIRGTPSKTLIAVCSNGLIRFSGDALYEEEVLLDVIHELNLLVQEPAPIPVEPPVSAHTLAEVARYVGIPFDRVQALFGVLAMVADIGTSIQLTAVEELQAWNKIRQWCAVQPYSVDGGHEFRLTMEKYEGEDAPAFTLCSFKDGKVLAGFNGNTLKRAADWCDRKLAEKNG